MSEIKVGKNETLESALRRFKRSCQKAGVLSEVRKREHYEKPSVKRKKKSEAAIAKEMKTRQDSLTEFEKAGREDLISHVKEEIAILQKYMPAQMTEDEIRDVVKKAIAECGDNVNMGNVMKHVMPHTKGRADGKLVNTIVKELLG